MPCSKGMMGCHRGCLHRLSVSEYRLARLNDEQAAEAASVGYDTEYEAYVAEHPLITFKDWLIGGKRNDQGSAEGAPAEEA